MLTHVKPEDARMEIIQSRAQLEKTLNRSIMFFSFPFGDFDEKLTAVCVEAGYKRVFTTMPVLAFTDPSEFAVGRVRVDPTDWPIEFRLKLAGAYRWLPAAFALKRKLTANAVARSILRLRKPSAARNSMVREPSSRVN
jgi:hypothetical protein